MSDTDKEPSVDDLMKAVYDQMDAAREQWESFLSAGEYLADTFADLHKLQKRQNRQGAAIFCGNKPSDFGVVDSAIANTGRILDEFVGCTRTLQGEFDKAMKLAMDGGDVGGHGKALMAGQAVVKSIAEDAKAAQDSWLSGLKDFMPKYRKFKFAAAEA